ncbi:BofC C-terminal domain-containing protein [Ruminococcus sp.]|uniref:BofC C-terminal domain-containing protein n=1 Tax=Ruminococcus sp. TaxID=41978 RepID=UPI0038700DB8
MKRLIIITGALLIGYLIMMTALAPAATSEKATSIAVEESDAENGYVIGISQGRVAVFREGELVIRTDTQLSDLPKSDRVRLEEGIRIDSLKELKERLQDYCS